MLVIGNVPTGLAIGTGGRVGRVMSGRILDGVRGKGVLRMCEHTGQGFVSVGYECGHTMVWASSLPKRFIIH
jgi:hypothetical protein